jgi:hypothetical protein
VSLKNTIGTPADYHTQTYQGREPLFAFLGFLPFLLINISWVSDTCAGSSVSVVTPPCWCTLGNKKDGNPDVEEAS